jgi:hypothetical protein
MNKMKRALPVLCAVLTICCIFFTSCGSSTLIRTVPDGAKVYIDGEPAGVTPFQHYDTKIVGSKTDIRLIMDGYEEKFIQLERNEDLDVGALVGGILFPPLPFLWIMKYKPIHTYEMTPLYNEEDKAVQDEGQIQSGSEESISNAKIDKLTKLKTLLDKGVLTIEEFNTEKKKILAE